MVTAQVENYTACEPELREIYPQHWKELAVSRDIPLRPDYGRYRRLDAAGCVILVTLRAGAKLVGYFVGFIFPELHYQTCLACTGDIFYVLPDYRQSFAGLKLFRAVEIALRKRKVQRWHVTSKLTNAAGESKDSGALMRRMGFAATEVHYSKRLD